MQTNACHRLAALVACGALLIGAPTIAETGTHVALPSFPSEGSISAAAHADILQGAMVAPVNELHLLADPVALFPNPPVPGGFYGWGHSVSAAGDVNGDGYADFIVSNRTVSPWGTYAVSLYYGSPIGAADPPSWSRTTYTKPATVSAAGDINGDGYDDVVIGSTDTAPAGSGLLEVFHGGPGGLGGSPSFSMPGGPAFGLSVCTAGDINGDGYDDVIVGQPLAGGGAGAAWLFYGSATGLSVGSIWIETPPPGFEQFGMTVAGLGDINGDGYDDMGVGSERVLKSFGNSTAGRAYLGSAIGPVYSSAFSNTLESSLRFAPAGDVNGDSYADYWVADPYLFDNLGAFVGFAGLVHGGALGPTGSSFLGLGEYDDYLGVGSFTAGDVNGDGIGDFLQARFLNFSGSAQVNLGIGRRAGKALTAQSISVTDAGYVPGDFSVCAAGDVNGDGFGDVIIGVPGSSDFGSGSGKVLIYYGRPDPPSVTAAAERFGGQLGAKAGWSVATGDVNGDGFDDVLVGKPLYDSIVYTDNGQVELYLGGEGGISTIPAWVGNGLSPDIQFGSSVSLGHDINGDGYGDILIGAPFANSAYVWFGRSDWSGDIIVPDQTLVGPDADAHFGGSVALVGDVNGDGFADAAVGAPYTRIGFPEAGYVHVYHGSSTGLVGTGWGATDGQEGAREGACVAAAGDLNSDGFSDLITGTGLWDGTKTDQGHARIYLGGPGGLAMAPELELTGNGPFEYFGTSVAGIGDFDGKGSGDVAIGASGAGPSSGGEAYVVLGEGIGPSTVPSWTASGPSGGSFGSSVSAAGDVNGDGYSDLLVGAPFESNGTTSYCGSARVYAGGSVLPTQAYQAFFGFDNFENLGQAVAGGGDVNGDGFGDLVLGAPRRNRDNYDEGSFRIHHGNWRIPANGGTGTGRGRPIHAMQPGPPVLPLCTYGQSVSPSMFGIAGMISSAGGRDLVAFDWSISKLASIAVAASGRTPWKPMGSPTAPLAGAALVSKTVDNLGGGDLYGWRTRVLSRSPWFRYGAWISPQPNGRGEWDIRLAPSTTDAPPVAAGEGLMLSPAWPNPATGPVHFAVTLPRDMNVRLLVRDLQGRVVQALLDGARPAGRHMVGWSRTDQSGRQCAAGIYFLELEAGGERRSTRVVVVR